MRAKKSAPRDRLVQTTLDAKRFAFVHKRAEAEGMTVATWLRRLVMQEEARRHGLMDDEA
jgi:hypothetical protein